MAQFTYNLTIKRDVDEVFRVFSDFEHAADRISGIKNIEVLTDGPIRAGVRFRETRVVFKKESTEEMEITAFEPNQFYTVECQSCGCAYTSTIRFSRNGAGTNVSFTMSAKPISTFAKIVSPLTSLMFGPMMRKCIAKDMDDLKTAIEKSTTSG